MRKALPLGLGVAAAALAAVFVGAAAAMTGAPVFYDARYPAAPSTASDGYDAGSGTATDQPVPVPTDDADQALADGAPPAAPAPGAPPGSSAPAPPSAPPTGPPSKAPGPPPGGDGGASDGIGTDDGTSAAPPTPQEQERWLAFQQVVRDCMAEAGQEYLYWEWWNPGPDTSNRFPAMPADLSPDEVAAWQRALNGNAGRGQDYRWQDAGCWGRAVHLTGGEH